MNYVNIGIVSAAFVVALVALLQSAKIAKKGWNWLSDDGQQTGGAIFVLSTVATIIGLASLMVSGTVNDVRRSDEQRKALFKTIEQNNGEYKVLQISNDWKLAAVEGVKNGDRLQVETNGHAPQVGEVWKVCLYKHPGNEPVYRITGRH